MKSTDVMCPICGAINYGLFLEETDGWMECEKCGEEFRVRYLHDGSYEYLEFPCGCEAEYHPINGEPSISEWLESLF